MFPFVLAAVLPLVFTAAQPYGAAPSVGAAQDTLVLRGDSATHFHNDPKYLHPDPAYVPGDYPLEEVGNARAVYYFRKSELASAVKEPNTVVTLDVGEITFTSVKDLIAPVQGYFRQFFGVMRLQNGVPASVDLVVDINSLDTAVPGRNNRILNVFFESMRPELGTAELKFTKLAYEKKELARHRDHTPAVVKATGTMTMNGVTRDITAIVRIGKEGNTWVVESVQPVTLLMSDYAFGSRVFELMKICNHRSIANAVTVDVQMYFR
jgi:polyisoprenoid-binding protein YceI